MTCDVRSRSYKSVAYVHVKQAYPTVHSRFFRPLFSPSVLQVLVGFLALPPFWFVSLLLTLHTQFLPSLFLYHALFSSQCLQASILGCIHPRILMPIVLSESMGFSSLSPRACPLLLCSWCACVHVRAMCDHGRTHTHVGDGSPSPMCFMTQRCLSSPPVFSPFFSLPFQTPFFASHFQECVFFVVSPSFHACFFLHARSFVHFFSHQPRRALLIVVWLSILDFVDTTAMLVVCWTIN